MSKLGEVPIPHKLNNKMCKSITYIPSSKFLILGSNEGTLLRFNTQSLEIDIEKETDFASIDSLCESILFNDPANFWVGASNSVHLFDLDLNLIKSIPLHEDSIIGLQEDGESLYSASEDGKVLRLDIKTSESRFLYSHNSPIISFDYNKDSQIAASSCIDSVLIIFSVKSSQILHIIQDYPEKIWSLKVFNGGVFTGDNLGCIKFFNIEKNDWTDVSTCHESRVKAICLTKDCKLLASCAFDSMVSVFEMDQSGNWHVEVMGKDNEIKDWIRCASFDDEGKYFYTVSDDAVLFQWEIVRSGECERGSGGGGIIGNGIEYLKKSFRLGWWPGMG